MLNVRGVTLFPSAIEQVVRGRKELGDEFQILLRTEDGMDELDLIVEAAPSVPRGDYEAVERTIAEAFRARLELRAGVQLLPPDTLPKTEFKAKRVRDERAAS
jgi:phenylacetate-CoA ligase